MNAVNAWGVRIGWSDLPQDVRDAVESMLGDTVVEAVSQAGGFSPGTADRVRTANGRRAFVKAVSPTQNARSTELNRREAAITAALPESVPAPRLLGCYDNGEWVALVMQDIEGRHPATPWTAGELARVLATLDGLAVALTPSPVPGLPAAADSLADRFAGWHRVSADPPAELERWVRQRLGELCALADRAVVALAGDALVHTDMRADNLLVGLDGAVTVVDWPRGCLGPPWLDSLMLLINVRQFGGHDPRALLTERIAATGADPDHVAAVLAALAGYFADAARKPPPPGIPHVNAFRRAQADAALSLLREALTLTRKTC